MEGNRDVNEKTLGRKREDWFQWEEPIRRLSVLAAGWGGRGDKLPFFSGKEASDIQELWLGFHILGHFSLLTKLKVHIPSRKPARANRSGGSQLEEPQL